MTVEQFKLDIQASCKIAMLSKILKLTIRAIRYGQTDGPNMIVESCVLHKF